MAGITSGLTGVPAMTDGLGGVDGGDLGGEPEAWEATGLFA